MPAEIFYESTVYEDAASPWPDLLKSGVGEWVKSFYGEVDRRKNEGKAHTRSMRYKMRSGMTLEKALAVQRAHIMERGETLEGYLAYFGPAHLLSIEWVKRVHDADHKFLNMLVRAALLKNAGHNPGDIDMIMRNKGFFSIYEPVSKE